MKRYRFRVDVEFAAVDDVDARTKAAVLLGSCSFVDTASSKVGLHEVYQDRAPRLVRISTEEK